MLIRWVAIRGSRKCRRWRGSTKSTVVSVCADYFMDRPFITASPAEFAELASHLVWLLNRCRLVGITRIVLPFVDASRIETPAQETKVVEMLWDVLPHAADAGVEIHLETSFGSGGFRRSAREAAPSDAQSELRFGQQFVARLRRQVRARGLWSRIGSVHIKDRVRGGGTVPLGQGDADIPALLSGLAAIAYRGDFVLQVARGTAGEEVTWARQNRLYLVQRLEEANR